MAEYIAAGIQMQQYAHRDDSVMFRDDMEEVFSRSPVETYTECLALSLFIDKQAGTLNLRMSHGNSPVDMLFCVPPSSVVHQPISNIARSQAATSLAQWGVNTWDGAAEDIRESYPVDIDQLRIVQYESCRGLEGWITVNLGLDTFYEFKLAKANDFISKQSSQTPGILSVDRISPQLYAARWLLIPLTRAIDTLVIQLDKRHSPVRTALEAAAAEYSDYIEWIAAT